MGPAPTFSKLRDGDDAISGGGGADNITAGRGDDTISEVFTGSRVDGGEGFDTLSFDFVSASESLSLTAGSGANLTLSNGVAVSNIERFGNIRLGSGNDAFTSGGMLYGSNYEGGGGTDLLRLDYSGTDSGGRTAASISLTDAGGTVKQLAVTFNDATTRSTYVREFERFDVTGSAGGDVLYGGALADTLKGGAGDDWLYGQGGYDTYRFGTNWGHDTIIDADATGRIVFDGIAQSSLTFSNDGGNLVVSDGTNQVTFNNYSANYAYDFVYENAPPPNIAIAAADAVKDEGDSGSTPFAFTFTRSGDLGAASSVGYTIAGAGANPPATSPVRSPAPRPSRRTKPATPSASMSGATPPSRPTRPSG